MVQSMDSSFPATKVPSFFLVICSTSPFVMVIGMVILIRKPLPNTIFLVRTAIQPFEKMTTSLV